jgi:hypothetical protein
MQTKTDIKTVRCLKDIKSLYDQIKASQANSKPLQFSLPSRNNALDLLNSPVDKTIAISKHDSKSNPYVRLTVTKVRS